MKRMSCGILSMLFACTAPAVMAQVADESEVVADPQEIANSQEILNGLFTQQWVKLSDEGTVEGKAIVIVNSEPTELASAHVALVKMGEILSEVTTDQDGRFTLSGISPGTYSLITRGEDSLSAFSLVIMDSEQGKHLDNRVDIRAVQPTSGKIKEILASQVIPPFLTRLDTEQTEVRDPLAGKREFAESHMVQLMNGSMKGQVAPTATSLRGLGNMTVYLTDDGKEVARTQADKFGKFEFTDLGPGNYGLVAAGSGGFAAVSFELVDTDALAKVNSINKRFVGRFRDRHLRDRRSKDQCCPTMNVECIPTCDITVCEQPVVTEVIEEVVVVEEPVVEEVCADDCGIAPSCGCGGGFAGGGGLLGGGGGLFGGGFGRGGFGGAGSGLLGAAGLAGVIFAISEADDDAVAFIPPPVVSAIAP